MNVFVSYGAASRYWAKRLMADLAQHGIQVWADAINLTPGLSFVEQIEQAVRRVDAIILLITTPTPPDEKQNLTWQAALEAVWSDETKRMIPFLLGDAEPPAFTRSTVPPDSYLSVIRARDPQQDWEQAVKNLVALLRNEAAPHQVERVPAITEADRVAQRQYFAELHEYIQDLKAELPADPAEWRARAMQH